MEDKKTEQATDAEQVPARKLPLKTLIVIVGVLLLEGATIGLFMLTSDPAASQASNPIEGMADTTESNAAEVLLVDEQQVDNYTQGRTRMLVDVPDLCQDTQRSAGKTGKTYRQAFHGDP